ncbi:MAG: carboxypeptidase regulatory-like domain-containing protein [Planctomycetes bacterium]|nr:carboxypeptidase regulatory-like domain-containing protein [Planctomycetota bacterium]
MKSSSLLAGLLALLIACGASFGAGYYVARDQAAETPNSRPIVAAGETLDEKLASNDTPLTAPDKTDGETDTPPEDKPDINNKHVEPETKPDSSAPTAETKPGEGAPGTETVEAKPIPGRPTEDEKKALEDQLKDLKDKIKDLKVETPEDFDDIFNGPKVDFAATVTGQVVDASGTPVAGASVHGQYNENYSSESGGGRMSFVVSAGSDAGPAIATTDASGYFTASISRKISEKASLQVNLTATADKFAESKKESFTLKNGDAKEGIKLVLRGAGSVSGRVVDSSGAGVEGVTVSLNPAGNGGFGGEGMDFDFNVGGKGRYNATTDISGEFVIEGVPEGRHKFKLSGAGYRQIAGPTEIDVKSGQNQRAATDFQVAITASVAAKFQDTEGKPVRGWATINFKDDNGKNVKSLSGPVDADGGFEKNDPPAGAYNIEVRVWGYKPYTTRATLLEGQRYDFGPITLEQDETPSGGGTVIIPSEDE